MTRAAPPNRPAPIAWHFLLVSIAVAAVAVPSLGCAEMTPEAASAPREKTSLRVTRGETTSEDRATPAPQGGGPQASVGGLAAATPLSPPPRLNVAEAAPKPLLGGATSEGPLPIPTLLAATRNALFVFGKTQSGYVVRVRALRSKTPAEYSPPIVVGPVLEDDLRPVVAGDGDSSALFAVGGPDGVGTRVVRVDARIDSRDGIPEVVRLAPRDDGSAGVPARLGRIAAIVPMRPHIAFIGRDGGAITFARLVRGGTFLESTAKVIARGSLAAKPGGLPSRSPRATLEDERILLAWDADDVPGALPTPGTTAAERAAPKPGIFVRRFNANGDGASPIRRLTRPGFEAHALDVIVELGASAVLASTSDGFEMFRVLRKGDDLGPYGGGLHLAGSGGDVSLATDVVGTLAVTSTKLLRIGPGTKIVGSPLGITPPAGGTFDAVQVASDAGTAHVLFTTRTSYGVLPTLAKIDGERMGAVLPTPWVGPPAQSLALLAVDGDEALAIVSDAGVAHTVRMGLDGAPRSSAPLPTNKVSLAEIRWARAPVPRAARAAGEWLVSLRDGRVLVATGAHAGTVVPMAAPKGTPAGGIVALVSNPGNIGNGHATGGGSTTIRAVYLPPHVTSGSLATTTIDPLRATAAAWAPIPETERHYGALGGARYAALPRDARAGGGLYLVANSGPKVSSAAQLHALIVVDPNGVTSPYPLDAPGSMQDLVLVPSTAGAVAVTSVPGRGTAARWLDAPAGASWRESFALTPFRARGDGPFVYDGVAGQAITVEGSAPFALGKEMTGLLGERCRFEIPVGPRSVLLGCEEGSGGTPLAARATARAVRF